MPPPKHTVLETRHDQAFPELDPVDIERVRRFGEVRSFEAGETIVRHGEAGHGLTIVLSGEVEVSESGSGSVIVTHRAGSFLGELAQLSGRPFLVDAKALAAVQALVIPPERLRALLIAEAEIGERIMRALILRRVGLLESGVGGPVIVGRTDSNDVLRLEGFLARSAHPHHTLDPITDAEARALIERFHVDPGQLPIVLCPNGKLLRNPSESALARCLGLVGAIDPARTYDVTIVGAGPAGLAAAVYAASEGLSVLVLDCRYFGGQAGASARIENYLGFPTGISGLALMGRAHAQAQKFGAEMAIPDEAAGLVTPTAAGGPFVLRLATGEKITTRATIIATGARYRRLDVEGLEAFEGASVHYWASPLEANLCAGQEVALVGAGNSAGQAVVYLSDKVAKVWLVVSGRNLETSMSRYLVDRIKGLPNVEIVTGCEVIGLEGSAGLLQSIRCRHTGSDQETLRKLRHLFLFIGAEPNTDWLSGSGIALDAKGFILTGRDAGADRHALETSQSGVFAIGDVRSGSVKRVAAAVGEGAQAVAAVHTFLAEHA